jgi:hypothetical protein
MVDAIGKAGVHLLAAEVEVRFARMADRPAADAVVEVEQAGLFGDRGAGPGGNKTARWGRWDRRLLVARALAKEATGTDRDDAGLSAGGLAACSAAIASCSAGSDLRASGLVVPDGLFAFLVPEAAAGAGFSFALTGEGRAFSPSRWALPITALRLTPPNSSAIWLAVAPLAHILASVSIRSSVQLIRFPSIARPCDAWRLATGPSSR